MHVLRSVGTVKCTSWRRCGLQPSCDTSIHVQVCSMSSVFYSYFLLLVFSMTAHDTVFNVWGRRVPVTFTGDAVTSAIHTCLQFCDDIKNVIVWMCCHVLLHAYVQCMRQFSTFCMQVQNSRRHQFQIDAHHCVLLSMNNQLCGGYYRLAVFSCSISAT